MLTVITAVYCVRPEPVPDPRANRKARKIVELGVSSIEDAERMLVIVYASGNRVLPDGNSKDSL